MDVEGITLFLKDLGLDLETAESLLGSYILGFDSFTRVTLQDFERAMAAKGAVTVAELGAAVKSDLAKF